MGQALAVVAKRSLLDISIKVVILNTKIIILNTNSIVLNTKIHHFQYKSLPAASGAAPYLELQKLSAVFQYKIIPQGQFSLLSAFLIEQFEKNSAFLLQFKVPPDIPVFIPRAMKRL